MILNLFTIVALGICVYMYTQIGWPGAVMAVFLLFTWIMQRREARR